MGGKGIIGGALEVRLLHASAMLERGAVRRWQREEENGLCASAVVTDKLPEVSHPEVSIFRYSASEITNTDNTLADGCKG
jgi:hypothetical protein